MIIEDLVNEYKNKIVDFIEVYEIKMTTDDIQKYVNYYQKQLKNFQSLKQEDIMILNEAYSKSINEIIDFKRNLGFTQIHRAEFLYNIVKSEFEKEIKLNVSKADLELIVDNIFQTDPWKQSQPKNDDEFIMHEKWWLDIQLWKIKKSLKSILNNKKKEEVSKNDELLQMIKDFLRGLETGNLKYSVEQIEAYLIAWEKCQGLNKLRSRAKKESGLTNVPDSTVRFWEEKWVNYKTLRTAK